MVNMLLLLETISVKLKLITDLDVESRSSISATARKWSKWPNHVVESTELQKSKR
ncbi:hypothetical protein SK128_002073 [Halocaridina rubra]|uniref:Uncharacterized protein n=1 Tax=Halocaridina rubra TaxID=373956 RepID=A0AAN9A5U2_HALRR